MPGDESPGWDSKPSKDGFTGRRPVRFERTLLFSRGFQSPDYVLTFLSATNASRLNPTAPSTTIQNPAA
jgi:hypothetical protein